MGQLKIRAPRVCVASSIVALAILSGCGDSDTPTVQATTDATDSFTIGLVPRATDHVFWKAFRLGAQKVQSESAAAEEPTTLELLWEGATEGDVPGQIAIMEGLIEKQVDGIVISPVDRKALAPVVDVAIAQGIPVCVVDSSIDTHKILGAVATEHFRAAMAAGTHMAGLIGNKGRVAVYHGVHRLPTDYQRASGFMTAFDSVPGVEVANRSTPKRLRSVDAFLSAYVTSGAAGPSVQGIFCMTASDTEALLKGLEVTGLSGRVKVIGFDTSPVLRAALVAQSIDALIVQDPVNMGYTAVSYVMAALKDSEAEIPPITDSPWLLVTPATMNEAAAKKLLSPIVAPEQE